MFANVQFDLELVDDLIVDSLLPLLVDDQLLNNFFVVSLRHCYFSDFFLH
jgi:hypothetical protein